MTEQLANGRHCPACGAESLSIAEGAMAGWPLARCRRCGLRYTLEVPSDAELREIYDRLYSPGEGYQMYLDEAARMEAGKRVGAGIHRSLVFLRRYRPAEGDRLLEVGCGVGAFLRRASERGWDVEGIELSERAVAVSQGVHALPVRIGSFEELDFPEHAYGAIAAWEVLEHLPEPRRFLEKARRLLARDGLLVGSVPNESPRVPRAVRGPATVPPVHLNFWDRDSLAAFLELNGFDVEQIVIQRTMPSLASPRLAPLRFAHLQLGALFGAYQGEHLFFAARVSRSCE